MTVARTILNTIALGLGLCLLCECDDGRPHPGETLFPCRIYSNFGLTENWGYINAEGKVRIKPTFGDAEPFSDGVAFVKSRSVDPSHPGWAFGLIREDGSWALLPQLDTDDVYAGDMRFFEGLCSCRRNGSYGYIDKSGNFKIPPKYESCRPFSDGLAVVQEGNHWHYINHDGESKFADLIRVEILPFENGFAIVKKGGKAGVINTLGNWTMPAEYDALQEFTPGRFLFKKDARYGTLDSAGKAADALTFEPLVGWCGDGMALLCQSGKYGAADLEFGGVVSVKPEWDRLSPFSEGRAAFENKGTSGYIDKSGKIIVDLGSVYDTLDPFKNDLAYVRKNNSHEGYLNKKGQWVFRRNLH